MSEEAKKSIWALWVKKSKSWLSYLNGTIEIDWRKFFISIFKNNYKKEDRHSDYTIAPLTEVEERPISETPSNNADNLPF